MHHFKGISRQARKIIDKVKNSESIPLHSAITLLDSLGFKKKCTGSHQIWRHPKGHRIQYTVKAGQTEVWGYQLGDLRKLLIEIEEKESVKAYEKGREKMLAHEIKSFYDEKSLHEKTLPNLSKLDLSGVDTKLALNKIADSHNKMVELLEKVASMVQSTQEYMIELGVKVDHVQEVPINILKAVPDKPKKPKLSPEERLEFLRKNAKLGREKRVQKCVDKIKEAQKLYPNYAKNPEVIAAFAKVGVATVKKYYKEGLV